MAVTFSTFDTTPTGAVAAIKAAILASSDWSNPAGQRVQCTTTRGADMVVDLADVGANTSFMQFAAYRTAALADKAVRYVRWRNTGGAMSDVLHCTVSAGKEHLWITVEGPRVGEANPEGSAGSYRPLFFLCDLLPYSSSDTVPAVVLGGTATNTMPTGSSSLIINVSRNSANSSSWVQGVLETLNPVRATYRFAGQSMMPSSGEYIARPWVVFEDGAGIRGRLSKFFFMGLSEAGSLAGDQVAPIFLRTTIAGSSYINLPVNRYPGVSTISSPFMSSGQASETLTPVIAVPFS